MTIQRRSALVEDELNYWGRVFACGADWRKRLRALGIEWPIGGNADPSEAAIAAAKDAWRRLGRRYLQGTGNVDAWALRKFGAPPGVRIVTDPEDDKADLEEWRLIYRQLNPNYSAAELEELDRWVESYFGGAAVRGLEFATHGKN